MEERRRSNDSDWQEIRDFIKSQTIFNNESRVYRERDIITQQYQVENIEKLKNQVAFQNGRVLELEKFREEIKNRIKNRREEIDEREQNKKDFNINRQNLINIIIGIVMAVSAIVMIFKK